MRTGFKWRSGVMGPRYGFRAAVLAVSAVALLVGRGCDGDDSNDGTTGGTLEFTSGYPTPESYVLECDEPLMIGGDQAGFSCAVREPDGSATFSFNASFSPLGTGTFEWADENDRGGPAVLLNYYGDSVGTVHLASKDAGSTVITSFGGSGSIIRGSFEGDLAGLRGGEMVSTHARATFAVRRP